MIDRLADSIVRTVPGRLAAAGCLLLAALSVPPGVLPRAAHGAAAGQASIRSALILAASGRGNHTTRTVTISAPWLLGWSYSCGGKTGRFQTSVYRKGQAAPLARVTKHGLTGHGTRLISTGGKVYLMIQTACSWHLTVSRLAAPVAPTSTPTATPTVTTTPSPTATPTATPSPTATPTTGPATSSDLAVHVSGNHLVNGQGHAIRLIGVNVPAGIQCVAAGPHVPLGIFSFPSAAQTATAIAGWHANLVRITLNEDCWLGINGGDPAYTGAAYRAAVAGLVSDLNAAGIYVILDLHTNAPGSTLATSQQVMADADHAAAYWASLAGTFKNNPAVIFQPYNEPHITTQNAETTNPWECWRDGCVVTELDQLHNTPIPGAGPWQAEGMQGLVNAIRDTGATNPILIDGLNWAQDLTQLPRYLPSDPLHQLIVDYHNYMSPGSRNTPTYWNAVIAPIAAQLPVMTSEFGEKDCGSTYVTQYMQWADQHDVSYSPWLWMTWDCSAMGLIADWDGTPSAYGRPFYDHFHAIPFTVG